MQLLKHPFQTTLSFTLFPLAISIISYLIEMTTCLLISHSPVSSEFPNEGSGSTRNPQESLVIALLRDLRGFMMSSYGSYFYFMGIMLFLHIVALTAHNMTRKFLQNQNRSISSPENHSIKQETPSSVLKKYFQSLIYFTISYYLCHLLIPNLPIQLFNPSSSLQQITHSESLLFNHPLSASSEEKLSFPHRILEETPQKPQSQKEETTSSPNYIYEIRTPRSNLDDPLPLIAQERGALSIVVTKDGNKLFQLTEDFSGGSESTHTISVMDITDPIVVKTYPSYSMNLEFCYQTLVLSNDSSTLFLIDCAKFYIFNVSNLHSPPELICSVQFFAEWNSSRLHSRAYNDKPSAAIYKEKKEHAIIIVNNGLHIYNLTDLRNPTRIFENKTFDVSPVLVVPRQKKMLLGGKEGLTAYDISDLQNPKSILMKRNPLKDLFVFQIRMSADQTEAYAGALIPDSIQEGETEIRATDIVIYTVFFSNIQNVPYGGSLRVPGLTSCRFTQSFLPDSVLPDFTTPSIADYTYYACGKDYGYIDTRGQPKLVNFTSVAPVNALALAHNNQVLLRVDSEQLNFFALYQNAKRNESFIWKPNFVASLKLNPNISNLTFSTKSFRIYFINQTSDDRILLQLYSTRLNYIKLAPNSIELDSKPSFCVVSDDGKLVFLKMGSDTIQIVSYPISGQPHMLNPIYFPEPIDDKFVVSVDNKMIFVTKTSQWKKITQTAIYTVNISDMSNPVIKQLVLKSESNMVNDFSQLMVSKDLKTLYILSADFHVYDMANLKNVTRIYFSSFAALRSSFILSPDEKMAYIVVKGSSYLNYRRIVFVNLAENYHNPPPLYIPNLAGELPLELSSHGNFLYLSTPEHLMEINVTEISAPVFTRLMKTNLKQFTLTKDSKYIYAIIGNYLEVIDLKTKHALISFKEDFAVGASYSVELKLLEANYEVNYDPVSSNHKFLTTNFYKPFISHLENEPILSYPVIPGWINFDKDTSVLTLEPRLPSHLGTYKIYTTGSLQVPSKELFYSIPALKNTASDPENIITDLVDRGYLDEDMFITAKFNPSRKLFLSPQYSQFESDVRYFLRDYTTGQEFAFTVSSSLFIDVSHSNIYIETLSPHSLTVHIYLRKNHRELEKNGTCQFVQRTYSAPRSILNDAQTLLILDGPLITINKALEEIIVDFNPLLTEYISIDISEIYFASGTKSKNTLFSL